jgi:type II secretory pathway component PulF
MPAPFTMRAGHGFEGRKWSDQLSVGLLESAASEGCPVLLGDAQISRHATRGSLRVAKIRSVLCVPVWSPTYKLVGLLYADSRTKTEVFNSRTLAEAQICARELEQAIFGASSQAPPALDPPRTTAVLLAPDPHPRPVLLAPDRPVAPRPWELEVAPAAPVHSVPVSTIQRPDCSAAESSPTTAAKAEPGLTTQEPKAPPPPTGPAAPIIAAARPKLSTAIPTPGLSRPAASGLGLRARAPEVTPIAPLKKGKQAVGAIGRPRSLSVTLFYRSLATMFAAGLPLVRSVKVLAQGGDDPNLCAVLDAVELKLNAGSPLSGSMGTFPDVFSRFELHLIRVGETTGSLHTILRDLADHRERAAEASMRVKNALTYPACVGSVSLLLLLFLPPYVLKGQFEVIRQSGQTPPLLTRIVMLCSDFVGSPLGLALIAGLIAAVVAVIARVRTDRKLRSRLYWQAHQNKTAGRILVAIATARFSRSLAVMCQVGVPLTNAFTLAAHTSDDPVLEHKIPNSIAALKSGAGYAESLRAADFFGDPFVHTLRAAEESGRVDSLLSWIARLYEEDLENQLDAFVAMVEPTMMLSIGIIVGVLLLATMLPMAHMLEKL